MEDLQRTIDISNKGAEYVAVHVNDLYEGWRLGLLAFTEEIERDPERRKRVYAKADQFFSALSVKEFTDLLDAIGGE